MQPLSPPKQQYTVSRLLAPLTIVSLFLGVAFGLLSNRATVVQAEEECVLLCSIGCGVEGHSWFGSNAIWMTVHAIPTNTTTGSAAIWKDLSPDSWAPMWVEGSWWDGGSNTVTALVKVKDNGVCDEAGDPNDWMRCHDLVGTVADHLCDEFTGVWERVGAGVSNCLSEFTYGFDFRKTITIDFVEFCFVSATITTKKPQFEGISSVKGLKARANCSTAGNLTYQNDTQEVEFTCQELSIQRPAGSVERLDVTVFWHY